MNEDMKTIVERLAKLESAIARLSEERMPVKQEYTIAEVASRLGEAGFPRKEKTVRSWAEQGRMPVIKRGKRVFVSRGTLENLIATGCELGPPKRLPPSQQSRYSTLAST